LFLYGKRRIFLGTPGMEEVELKLPHLRLFLGSYVKVQVVIDPSSGRPLEDLVFIIPAGPQAGIISLSRDADFNPERPDIMLCVGYKPGRYVLQAISRQSSSVVAETQFFVTDIWEDDRIGPSEWISGISELYTIGSTWGGGSPGPQNINVKPAKGTRRLAILLVETKSQLFTTDAPTLQTFRDRWMNEAVNGVTTGGVTRSAAHYYREVSYWDSASKTSLDLSAQVFGPVRLSGKWDDYFFPGGQPKAGFYKACVSAGDTLINFINPSDGSKNFDTLVCVSQSVNPTDPKTRKRAWPYADSVNSPTKGGPLNIATISMPNEWLQIESREIHATLSHELGHNLGLDDLYKPKVEMTPSKNRNPTGYDLMDDDTGIPHFSIVNRMIFGWILPTQIMPFDFKKKGKTNEYVTLHPIENRNLPPRLHYGIEIRIADGWNYYFEYRKGQSDQIGDRNLPNDNRVIGTEARAPETAPYERPPILFLGDDEDNDGSVLGNGKDYKETDSTDGTGGVPFSVTVSGIDGNKAIVHIQYASSGRPDPSIRNYPGVLPGQEWQSPDIEVSNLRNGFNKDWFNVPWEGHDNTVIATIKNSGDLYAPKVRVNFYVCEFNAEGKSASRSFIGYDENDIAAGATFPFSCNWRPPRKGHFCVQVDIPTYRIPGSSPVEEIDPRNNFAMSNYTQMISRESSPASREMTAVEVINPFKQPTRVFIRVQQTNPLYRTFIEHTSLMLEPGEKRKVAVMFEFANDTSGGPDVNKDQYIKVPNNVGITAFIEDPRFKPPHTAEPLGGAQVKVLTGRSTNFNNFDNNQVYFHGEVVTSNDNVPVPDGKVILTISLGNGKTEEMGLDLSSGKFSAQISHDWQSVRAYYVPIAGYADCNSKRIYNENIFRWYTETWERLQSFGKFRESTDELLNRLMDAAAEYERIKKERD
jgi:M6 family metalloprotease-like protein